MVAAAVGIELEIAIEIELEIAAAFDLDLEFDDDSGIADRAILFDSSWFGFVAAVRLPVDPAAAVAVVVAVGTTGPG